MVGVDEVLRSVTNNALEVAAVPALVRGTERFHVFRSHSAVSFLREVESGARPYARPWLIAKRHRTSGGFAGDNPVGGRGVDVECSDIGLGLEQVLHHFMDLGILLLVVAFGILFAVPEA